MTFDILKNILTFEIAYQDMQAAWHWHYLCPSQT